MGSSFFTGNLTELLSGTQNFSTKISLTPVLFGLTAAQATAYQTKNVAWRASYDAAKDPATRSKGKTATKNALAAAIRQMSSEYAQIIKATPTVTDEQKLDLGLSVRATPSPAPAPGTPYEFKFTLSVTGLLEFKWKCNNPPRASGIMYQVWRTVDGGTREYLGSCGAKMFTDSTLPSGASIVLYQVQAMRSTSLGAWGSFSIQFGTSASGLTTMKAVASPKLAA